MQQRRTRIPRSQSANQEINRALNRIYEKYGTNWDAFIADVKKDQAEAAKAKELSSQPVLSKDR